MSKATAVAHPIQGLIKYHGFKDPKLRIPLHDSISVCTAPFETRTTVELHTDLETDVIEVDGRVLNGREHERAVDVLNEVRHVAKQNMFVYAKSKNNFPSNIGLGASASGFAALAVATCGAFGLELSARQLSAIARLGAGSASRAVAGGYAYWEAGVDHETSIAYQLASGKDFPMGIVIALIPAYKSTENAHLEAVGSPFMPCRVAYVKSVIEDMMTAIHNRDFSEVGRLAEQDSFSLHAVTMTGPGNVVHWQPETLRVFQEVRAMRAEGLNCYLSVDTGATVYINSRPEDRDAVEARIQKLGIETLTCEVGGGAHLVNDHLF